MAIKFRTLFILFIFILSIGLYSFSSAASSKTGEETLADDLFEGYSLIMMNNTTIDAANQARDYVISQGGRIAILIPPHIMLGWVSKELAAKLTGKYGIEYITNEPISTNQLNNLDEQTSAAVNFFNAASSGILSAEMVAASSSQGEPLINR